MEAQSRQVGGFKRPPAEAARSRRALPGKAPREKAGGEKMFPRRALFDAGLANIARTYADFAQKAQTGWVWEYTQSSMEQRPGAAGVLRGSALALRPPHGF